MAEFLLELLSEEIPARMQARAAEDLRALLAARLGEARLPHDSLEAHVTPRRLTAVVDGLPTRQPDLRDERKGPREDAPQAAIDGFLRAAGVGLEQCALRETPKGRVWFAVVERPGRPTAEVLVEIIAEAITAMPWPKSMRWGDGSLRWVRPLQQILAVFDGAPVPGVVAPDPRHAFTLAGDTRGHRFLAPGPIPVRSFDDYRAQLRTAYVMLDRSERRQLVAQEAARLAADRGLTVREDPSLLDEVTGLVEWPVVLIGAIDPAFMDLPPEVLTTAMRTHQRYFSCLRPDGMLAPHFVIVAGTVTRDDGRAVVEGNERVLRARLADAGFYWEKDRKVPLADRVPALARIVFHARLGMMDAKVARLEGLAVALAERIPGADPAAVCRAATLCKADLVTGMVAEFPELQGVMGRYYASTQDEPPAVADAIADHYAPQGPADRCPTAPVSVALALADKLDTLVGFFAIDERPTGSRDPYALRRAALGVIRLVLENRLRLPLLGAVRAAMAQYEAAEGAVRDVVDERRDSAGLLLAFFADRLKVALREQGTRHDLIDAVFALGGEDDLLRLLARVDALSGFLHSDDGANLLVAYRRAANIVRIELKKDGRDGYGAVAPDRLEQAEERDLQQRLVDLTQRTEPLLAAEDFAGAMTELAALREPVDAFFDRVTVNADDPAVRRNRLALLDEIVATMNRVADFSRIEG